MLRRSAARLRLVSFVTDVEGDFAYFQRFVCISRVLKWEHVQLQNAQQCCTGAKAAAASRYAPLRDARVEPHFSSSVLQSLAGSSGEALAAAAAAADAASGQADNGGNTVIRSVTPHSSSSSSSSAVADDEGYSHLVDVSRHRLTFRDATSHFVFGGDAFDHGADLTFGRVLLDFKRRFPSRVHLLLGNRDANKSVFSSRTAEALTAMTAEEAEKAFFKLPPLPKDAVTNTAAAAAATLTEPMAYDDFKKTHLRDSQNGAGLLSPSHQRQQHMADAVTFLQWTLKHKLGSPNAFEHRRRELAELRAFPLSSAQTPQAAVSAASVSDDEVAASFFAAAQPGGIYCEYLRHGVLSVVLDGVLFVHGGVNGNNAGFVPSLEAVSYAEQITAGEWWLPETCPEGAKKSGVATTRRKSALQWLEALSAFKDAAFVEWVNGTGLCGEALRAYVYPRVVAPHSVAVGTVMTLDGPHHVPLTVAAYLLESGIHTVCGGHQPVGDTPAVVRQPGGFAIVDADNSYCGRGNAFSTRLNRRGAAVTELLFDSDDGACENGAAGDAQQPDAESASATATSLIAHGLRADGTPYEFDLYGDLRVGRHVGDGWWVRLPPSSSVGAADSTASNEHAGRYELRRTRDGFRHEEVRWATASEVDAWLRQAAASGQATVDGDLAMRFTKEELAEVRVHRLKTKVTRAA